jgi:hypothetical protein
MRQKYQKRFRLAGFFNPRNSYPAFVMPFFYDRDSFYVQEADSSEIITSFLPWEDEPYRRNLPSPIELGKEKKLWFVNIEGCVPMSTDIEIIDDDTCSVGDPMHYAIAHPPIAFVGDRDFIKDEICRTPEFASADPFFAIELASFVGDKVWLKENVKLAAKLLFGDNAAEAKMWVDLTSAHFEEKLKGHVSLRACWKRAECAAQTEWEAELKRQVEKHRDAICVKMHSVK